VEAFRTPRCRSASLRWHAWLSAAVAAVADSVIDTVSGSTRGARAWLAFPGFIIGTPATPS
jgi:hypothetical protein